MCYNDKWIGTIYKQKCMDSHTAVQHTLHLVISVASVVKSYNC